MPKKLTLEDMHQLTAQHGGKCLSDRYVNSKTKLLWECVDGHQWEAIPSSVKIGYWCPYCAGQGKPTIQELQGIALARGGKCLSDAYTNNKTKLLWECKECHQWEAVASSIKNNGSWCPVCADKNKGATQRFDIQNMHTFAQDKDGKCLSDTYVNAHSKLLWECAEGHQWEATPNSVKRGAWCPHCYGRYPGIEELHKIASENQGRCLSDNYVNANTKLLWECKEGHQWEATPTGIKSGTWCPFCGGSLPLTIVDMQSIALERGGICLTEKYINAHTHLVWECAHGHKWKATANNICKGKWCPTCATGLGERICREFFEQIFQRKFPKAFPGWLLNSRGNQMELDGYCESLNIAFEHHGQQHYGHVSFFQSSMEEFQKRQHDDETKRQLCKEHGVILIEVPELSTLLPIDELKPFLKAECKRYHIPLPQGFETRSIDLKNAYVTQGSKDILDRFKVLAQERGGKCLSEEYINSCTKLRWVCAKGHQWEAAPSAVKLGAWCPICGGSFKLTIEEIHRNAQERGGKCLSGEYKDAQAKLLWECSEGHQWKATANSIRNGSWCKVCSDREKGVSLRLDINSIHSIAQEHGGKCLSDKYTNAYTKLIWECSNGHQWEATPSNVKNNGRWCPACAGRIKLTIEEMQQIAQERGGRCLSNEYINTKTKLLWECSKGHQWEAAPEHIKRGQWCQKCKNSR